MCGICGICHFDSDAQVESRDIERMNTRLAHRGPDQEGIWCSGSVGLGHRRLSIIDLSEAASQPMTNEDGSLILVFNGEIYNFQPLRDHSFMEFTATIPLVQKIRNGEKSIFLNARSVI